MIFTSEVCGVVLIAPFDKISRPPCSTIRFIVFLSLFFRCFSPFSLYHRTFSLTVPKRIFENQHEPPQLEIFQQLENDKNARIIRHLCIIRTAIERNFKYINDKMRTEYKTILSLSQFVPADSISQLSADNVNFIRKWNTKLPAHIIEINRIISDRINNCKHLFPLWLNWKYIRELFIMPNGLCEKGTQEAAAVYYEHILLYPYQMYIHWSPSDQGNILFNDKRFVSLLYRWHNDEFTEYNKVSDAGSYIKDSIYDFIDDSRKVVIVVDCENSDPYKLSATLRRLNSTYTEKITSIILFDDIHTASAWSSLEKFTSVSVEHILIERIKQNKSLVDIRLTARACQEYYENNVDSFIIVSSDSDYWGLISSLPKAQFLVMIEHNKCGPDMKAALANSGIFYCYLDDFYSGDSEELKTNALLQEMRDYMEKAVQLNAIDMLNDALRSTRIEMTSAERQQFYDKYIKTLQLSINDDGKVSLVIKVK